MTHQRSPSSVTLASQLTSARQLLAALPLVLGFLCGACGTGEPARPNIILVTMDTTRADALGTYGAEQPTPCFDALAAEGARFDMALSASAVTPVSHASILTGLYPYQHGLRVLSANSGFRLPADMPTVATRLKAEGYRTGAVHSAFPVSAYFGFDEGFDVFESFDSVMRRGTLGDSWDTQKFQRRSDHTTDLALDFIEQGEGPYFLWIHYWDPHDPALVPPPELIPPGLPRSAEGRLGGSIPLYLAEVRYVDSQFARIVESLRARGDYAETLLVITSDHGEGLGEHDWWAHRLLYQEQIRVPLILRPPGVNGPAVGGVSELVRTIDIAPTILDYAGSPHAGSAEGASLRPYLEGLPREPRTAYADQINGYDHNARMLEKRPNDDLLYMVSDGRHKLTWRPTNPSLSELYDITKDPREADNIFLQRPDIATPLLVDLARRHPWVVRPFPEKGETSADASTILQGLGYAGGAADTPEDWLWTCPLHRDVLYEIFEPCPKCGGAPLPVAKQAE
ncbi:MAG: sulfatase [Planctomycetota bacterium]|jgi:arylsulfatase A-like enzyme|nr:sulfatase [Planctomycetota bacterium]MDP6838720.1 sulfatase [Planctomycetota bacterium]